MSLQSSLNTIIKDRGGEVFTLKDLEDYCHKAQYKVSNGEKRLRDMRAKYLLGQLNPDYDPTIIPVYNNKHTAIIGYRYQETPDVIEWFKPMKSEPKTIAGFVNQLKIKV